MTRNIELEELLFSYAAGHLSQEEAVVVATHLALCPESRKRLADFEVLQAFLADDGADEPVLPSEQLADVLCVLDEPVAPVAPEKSGAEVEDNRIPKPLREYLDKSLENLAWRFKFPGVREYALGDRRSSKKISLLRIEENASIPSHTHQGSELTLVLSGGFTDSRDHFGRGDVCIADTTVDHRPVADPGEPCFCLAVTDGSVRLTGPYGRIFDKITGR